MKAGPEKRAGPPIRQRIREVFSSRGFRPFFAARAVSQLGDGIFQIAAADILLFDDSGANPALRLAIVSAATLIPFSAIGPFVGVFIDRWERRAILVWAPILRAILAASLLTFSGGRTGPAFYLVVLLVLSINRFFLATMGAVLPQFVPRDDLLVANSVASTGGSVANVVGLGLGAGLSQVLGGPTAGVVASITFTATAVLALRVPARRGSTPSREPILDAVVQVVREMVEGIRRLVSSRRAVYALTAIASVQTLVGAMTAILVFYFIAELGLDIGGATSLLAVIAVGIFAGIVLVPAVARRIREDQIIPLGFVVAALGVSAGVVALSRTTVAIAGVLVGIAYAFAKIPVDTIVQEEIPDAYRGRAFAAYDVLFNIARVTGVSALALVLEVRPETQQAINGIWLIFFVAAAAFFMWERGLSRAPQSGPVLVTDLLPPGELVVVRAYAGGRADEEPRAIVVGGQELPVEAVEWRAVEERSGQRRRVFVVRVAGGRVRISAAETSARWEVERHLPAPPT